MRLEANGQDKHGWKEEAIDLMCEQRPDIPQIDDEELPSRVITGSDIRKWIKTLYVSWKDGAEPVSVEVQDHRASICATCPKRAHVSCFGGCGVLAQVLSEMVIGAKGKTYPELHKTGCGVCGCEISSLILFPDEVLKKVDEEMQFPISEYPWHCWRRAQPKNIPPNPESLDSSAQPPPLGT